MLNKKTRRTLSIRLLQKKAEAKAKQIIKMIENAHQNAGKSKLKFDCPLDPTNPQSVAIFHFLKEVSQFQTALRKVKILARTRHVA